ncbi:MAG: hypothetical protein LC674_01010, partial [Actinobacteria bacterium]|nr:hypothetical protein [Actinomycetota bacterium]
PMLKQSSQRIAQVLKGTGKHIYTPGSKEMTVVRPFYILKSLSKSSQKESTDYTARPAPQINNTLAP